MTFEGFATVDEYESHDTRCALANGGSRCDCSVLFERTRAVLNELAETSSHLATLMHAVRKGAVLTLSPASGQLITQQPFKVAHVHGPITDVLRELALNLRTTDT